MRKPHKELLHATAYRYTVLFERAPEGGYVATIPVLGIATQGDTLREARAMARDAIRGLIESLAKDGEEIPIEQPAATTERLAVRLLAVRETSRRQGTRGHPRP
jgi:antitoxin HicB